MSTAPGDASRSSTGVGATFDVRYGGGAWWCVVTRGAVLLLAPQTAASVVRWAHALLRSGDDAATLAELLGPSRRVLDLPSFALVVDGPDTRRVVVRGVVAEVDGDRVDGRGVLTWVEHPVPASAQVHVVLQPEADVEPTLRVRDGVVRCGAVQVGARSSGSPSARRGHELEASTVVLIDEAPTEAAPTAGAAASSEEPTAVLVAAAGAVIMPDGSLHRLDRSVIVGRRPSGQRSGPGPRLVTVDSPTQDISRSHVEIRPEGGNAVVVDLATSNGTMLRRQGRPPLRLTANQGQVLLDEDVIDLGDDVLIRYIASKEAEDRA